MHQQLSQRVNAALLVLGVNSMSYKLDELEIWKEEDVESNNCGVAGCDGKLCLTKLDEDDEPLDCYDVMASLGECCTAVSLDLRVNAITPKCAYTSDECYACATMGDLCIHDFEKTGCWDCYIGDKECAHYRELK